MLTVQQLIDHLTALNLPDAPVFFVGADNTPFMVAGGIAQSSPTTPGGMVVRLGEFPRGDQDGGF